jgi:stage V sporulation protein SpoVS
MADTQAADAPETKVAVGAMAKHASAEAQQRAAGNWARASYVRSRGHRNFQVRAQRCDRFYLGAGEQWELENIQTLAETGRKPIEDNQVMQMVNTAIGYQIANRMDISVSPRGHGANDDGAALMGKIIKYIVDESNYSWRETEVFGDGMIMSRGFFDIRMDFEKNLRGEVATTAPDPLDVMPDPDARDYDPDNWADVTLDRFYTASQIGQLFGAAAKRAVEAFGTADSVNHLNGTDGVIRPHFGDVNIGDMGYMGETAGMGDTVLYRVVDRQYRVYELVRCAVYPTGDIRLIPDATPEQVLAYKTAGALITKRMQKRIKWLVSTSTVSLFDDYSPYPWFTIVPFFPYFRRGQTRGMVDNAIILQESLNKGLSQFGHILNTVANSGWLLEQNSLVDMDEETFKIEAAKNGALIVYKEGSQAPKKIESSPVPAGMLEYVSQMRQSLTSVTGMEQALSSAGPMNEMSGVAYQARQYAAQQKLAVPLDNLARTRHMVANRYVDLVQMFFDAPRVFRITETDQYGKPKTSEVSVNQPVQQDDGSIDYLNDLTLGEYGLVISEQPMQITFDNSQFEQVKSLKLDFGYPVPPAIALRYSSLADKDEIGKAIEDGMQAQPDPVAEAKAALLTAQKTLADVTAVGKRIESVYGATQAGTQIATLPQVASLADEILQSSGFVDQNAAPIPMPTRMLIPMRRRRHRFHQVLGSLLLHHRRPPCCLSKRRPACRTTPIP